MQDGLPVDRTGKMKLGEEVGRDVVWFWTTNHVRKGTDIVYIVSSQNRYLINVLN